MNRWCTNLTSSVPSLCSLWLCGGRWLRKSHHGGTANTEVAQSFLKREDDHRKQGSLLSTVLILVALLGGISLSARADEARPVADDPVLEERVMNLSRELRCLVCQNETLADSRADLAVDLRNQVREQMKAGKSDEEIISFLTARYGEFVLYRPRVRPATYLLWFGPFILLLGGLLILFRYVKSRREAIIEAPLSDDERKRAESLLRTEPRDKLA
jgi:cytochrome c-type biogenesis protein CcmH